MVVILMGVSGCGKTTIGQRLAAALDWPFYEGDDFHPAANVEKMSRGIPLSDADREPWLRELRAVIEAVLVASRHAVLTCSALKQRYRDRLAHGHADVHFVYLRGSMALIQQRLARRSGHFMPAGLLQSQFDALEEPTEADVVDISRTQEDIVRDLSRRFSSQ